MMGPIAKVVPAGTVLTLTRYVPYRCRGTPEVRAGYKQRRRPGHVPFDVGGVGNANVGIARASPCREHGHRERPRAAPVGDARRARRDGHEQIALGAQFEHVARP
jgi:hypothetical protein